jgi:hypothetical protein
MNGPAQTPLVDLLRGVPRDARLIYNYPDGASQSIPVGHLAAEAIEAIAAAHIKGREEGLMEAMAECEKLYPDAADEAEMHPYHAAMQTTHECAAAIERLLTSDPK